MLKLKIQCRSCGYTWYPDKEKWESNPNAPEPDCPNPECPNYGVSNHPTDKNIWEILESVNLEEY